MQSFSLLTILATSLISLTSGAPTPGLICSSVKPLAGSVFNLMLFDKIKSRNWASWTNMPDGPWAGSSNPPFPYLGPTNGGSQCYSFGKILNDKISYYEVSNGCCRFYEDSNCANPIFDAGNRNDNLGGNPHNNIISSIKCTRNGNCDGL